MSMSQEQPGLLAAGKKARNRAKRRDYKRELVEIKTYCEINVEILNSMGKPPLPGVEGKIEAFTAVIRRIAL